MAAKISFLLYINLPFSQLIKNRIINMLLSGQISYTSQTYIHPMKPCGTKAFGIPAKMYFHIFTPQQSAKPPVQYNVHRRSK